MTKVTRMRRLFIQFELKEMANMSCKPSISRPKNGDIIDEDKSVKWNREEVIRLQEAYDEEVKKLNTIKNNCRDELYKELYKIIKREVGNITINDARQIFQYVYDEYYSRDYDGYDKVFEKLDVIIALFSNIVNHKNK